MATADRAAAGRHPWFSASDTPRVLAHRGLVAPGESHAENTVAATVSAVSAGARYVESDCHLTRDGVAVLFHDDSVERVTGDPRLVADLRLRELRTLMEDLGGLLTLRDALGGFPEVRWNLDVKAAAAAEPAGAAIAAYTDRVLVTSFSESRRRAALEAARRSGAVARPATSASTPLVARALLTHGIAPLFRHVLRGVDALQIPERHGAVPVLTGGLIRAAHRAGIEVHVWTVNDPERMDRLIGQGVDGLVTDRADIALARR